MPDLTQKTHAKKSAIQPTPTTTDLRPFVSGLNR